MKQKIMTLVGTTPKGLTVFVVIAVLGCLAIASAVRAQATSTFSVVRGFQETSSTTTVELMNIPGLGQVEVNCPSGPETGIAFYPTVSGSLWITHGGVTTFFSGSTGQQLSRQSSSDTVTAQFATASKTVTIVVSEEPGSTCIYAGQAIIQS
jgi:hypothetical protein